MGWLESMVLRRMNRKGEQADRTTLEYLENITPASCLRDLNTALDPLLKGVQHVNQVFTKFATANASGTRVWNRKCFDQYVYGKLGSVPPVTAYVPLWWRIFSSAAYYPFSPPGGDESGDGELDLAAFERSFALLAMRGIELFGTRGDGRSYDREDQRCSDKVTRLARIICKCMSLPDTSLEAREPTRFQDIKDTILFTQPVVPDRGSRKSQVRGEHFDAAANRLLQAESEKSTMKGTSRNFPTAELQHLVRILLLLCPDEKRWRDGLFNYGSRQRSGDIHYAHVVNSPEEPSQASDFASALLGLKFGASESVPWDAFETWCSDHPTFVFLFFELWAAIFAPITNNTSSPSATASSSLPTSTINLLSFSQVAHFFSGEGEPNYRYHGNELQLSLDLQAATLVADISTDVPKLHKILTEKTQFFVLLMHGEEVTGEQGHNRLLAALVSPNEPGMEMGWNRKDGSTRVSYVWGRSAIQLLPQLAFADEGRAKEHHTADRGLQFCGGLSAQLSSDGGRLELIAHDQAESSITIDLKERVMSVACQKFNIPGGQNSREVGRRDSVSSSSVSKLRLTGLEIYCLPGVASGVTHHPSVMETDKFLPENQCKNG